jgi:hypothetical protein
MFSLTRQEQLIIVAIIAALLVGAAVKQWRLSQPRVQEASTDAPAAKP